MHKINLIFVILFVIMFESCKPKIQFDENPCYKCFKQNTVFIDTIQSINKVYDLAKSNFESNNLMLLRIGLIDYGDRKELFRTTYGKIKYDIDFLPAGDVASEKYSRYNEAMWSFLKTKYGVDEGIFYREYTEKYNHFIVENQIK